VAGDSAGGNLTAAVVRMTQDRGGPGLAAQVLIYPVTNCAFDTESYRLYGDGSVGLAAETMAWFWKQYLPSDADADNPLASPLRAKDVRKQPPALVVTAEIDVLRDEGEAYLHKLRAAGVSAVGARYLGMPHGFLGLQGSIPTAKQAVRQVCEFLRGAFGQGT
jgi:acetyl esterase